MICLSRNKIDKIVVVAVVVAVGLLSLSLLVPLYTIILSLLLLLLEERHQFSDYILNTFSFFG